MVADHELIGKVGRVTGTIEPGKLGEVMIAIRGGSESYYAYAATRKVGQAEGAALDARGAGEGEAVKAKGLAEAEAIRARAEALAHNQEAVIAQQIAEQLPQVVGEAAKAFGSIGQMTVLNGAEGVGQMFSQVLGMGAAAVPMIRNLLAQNGAPQDGGEQASEPMKEARPRTR